MRTEETIQDVECGKAKTTRYFDEDNKLVRQDVEIIVDPDKVPGLRGIVNFAGEQHGDNSGNL